ncbi:MAG TPA: hypothetical protein VHM24_03200, partial [Gemmatimonadaceae bacterium]|nr:hypothetical protein [Gemmatimonadaceae bacterium]
MTLRVFGMVLIGYLQLAISSDMDRARILVPAPGQQLPRCQTFRWRSPLLTAQTVLALGSCPGCTDIAYREPGPAVSATLALPTNGREIYVTLATIFEGTVIGRDTQVYRASTNSGSPAACTETVGATIGVYHWSGKVTHSMSQGVQTIAQLGGSAVRLTLSPRTRRDYNVELGCIPNFTLASFLGDPDVRQALSDSSMRTIMLTTFDGTTFADCEQQLFLNPDYYTATVRARLVEEYADFAYELIRTHRGSGKTFIISNWESDNAVYCGSSWSYVNQPDFRRSCDQNYPTYYNGNKGPGESLLGLREWFRARQEGLDAGRSRARVEGLSGVVLYHAPEINSARDLRQARFASVLTDVLPYVHFDYISYSSWESLNRLGVREEIASDLDAIRAIAGTDALI